MAVTRGLGNLKERRGSAVQNAFSSDSIHTASTSNQGVSSKVLNAVQQEPNHTTETLNFRSKVKPREVLPAQTRATLTKTARPVRNLAWKWGFQHFCLCRHQLLASPSLQSHIQALENLPFFGILEWHSNIVCPLFGATEQILQQIFHCYLNGDRLQNLEETAPDNLSLKILVALS